MTGIDVLGVIEGAYDLELGRAAWLRQLAERTFAQVGGRGLLAFDYMIDASDRVVVGEAVGVDLPPPMVEMTRVAMAQLPPWYVQRTFVKCDCTTQSDEESVDDEVRAFNRQRVELMARMGIHDVLMVGGMSVERTGIFLGAYLAEPRKLEAAQREMWSRIAVHVVTAARLRARLSHEDAARPDTADAILSPDGRVEDAKHEARETDARDELRDAVLRLEKARGPQRHDDPAGAVGEWTGLVSGRWTFLDHFESSGRRYVIARRNDPRLDGPAALTDREKQVVAHAALGHANKLIAYELGLADSTVRVLIARACEKLGVDSREALIARWIDFVASTK